LASITARWVTKSRAASSGFGLGVMPNMIESLANNTLEQTVKRGGRVVLAMDWVLADAPWLRCLAAQLGR
jgi:hypothetical protein